MTKPSITDNKAVDKKEDMDIMRGKSIGPGRLHTEPHPVKRTEKKYKVFPVSSRALLAAFYAARQSACFSIGVRTPRLR